MNLSRLRTLLAAWQDGLIREAELVKLRDALPNVIAAKERPSDVIAVARTAVEYADRLSGLAPAESDIEDAAYDYERGEWPGDDAKLTRYGMFVQGFMHALLHAR